MTPTNQVDINAYVFAEDDLDSTIKHAKDVEKLFPTSQYQGRTIKLNWCFNTKINKTPPTIEPKKQLMEDLVVYIPRVVNVGRPTQSWLKEDYFTRITPALKPSSKILIQAGYTGAQVENDESPLSDIKSWASKEHWKEGKNPPSVVPFVYRKDQLDNPKYRGNNAFFMNEKDVIEVIEGIVKSKLESATAGASQPGRRRLRKKTEPQAPVVPVKADVAEPKAVAKQEEKKADKAVAAKVVNEPAKPVEAAPKAAEKVEEKKADKSVVVEKLVIVEPKVIEEEKKANVPPAAVPVVNELMKIEVKAEAVKQEAVQKEEKPAPVQDKQSFRFVSLILSAIPSLVAAVTAVASRIFLPKVKEVGAVGLGFLAGWISTFACGYLVKKQNQANIV